MILLRNFSNLSEAEMLKWFMPRRWIEVKDDQDRTMKIDSYSLAVTWYGLSIHRDYPKFDYQIEEIFQSDIIEDKSLAKPIEHFLAVLKYHIDNPVEMDQIKQRIYEWQIKTNNFIILLGQGGEVSASALDVEEVMSSPEVVEIKEKALTGEITTDEASDRWTKVIKHSKTIPINPFVTLNRTNKVTTDQSFQTTIKRGSVFDLSKKILPNPIETSFAEGIVNLADALGENKGAGIALISNGKALEDSEWFHRKLHISSSVIMDVAHMENCGTDRYIAVKMVNSRHAKAFLGKYILHEGEEVLMDNHHLKLYKHGDIIHSRSVAFCEHPTPGVFCGRCYGKMKTSLPYNVIMAKTANPGLYSATEIAERIGQALLSTKHYMRHTTAIPFVVKPADKDVIWTDGDYIYAKEDLSDRGLELSLDALNASDLTDFKGLDSLDEMNEDQLRNFEMVGVSYLVPDPMIDAETRYERSIGTSISSRRSRMSRDLIEYALDNGWEREKKRMTIKLDKWDFTKPLFFLPYVHEDLNQYRVQIEGFLMFKNRNDAWMRREVTEEIFGEVLGELWGLVDHKFKGINIVHPEILLSSLLTRNPEFGYYGLPEGREPRFFQPFIKCIENRGMGGLYIFQNQNNVLERYTTYGIKGRSGGLMEADIAPAVM